MFLFAGWDPILRVLVAGPVAFVAMVVLLRLFGKRTLSKMNAFDFIVTVALGSLLATVIIDENVSLATGIAAFAVLIGSQFLVTWISVRSGEFERFIKAEPTVLFREGQMSHPELRRTRVTEREVVAMARRAGVQTMEGVEAVVLETDGSVSVIAAGRDLGPPDS